VVKALFAVHLEKYAFLLQTNKFAFIHCMLMTINKCLAAYFINNYE